MPRYSLREASMAVDSQALIYDHMGTDFALLVLKTVCTSCYLCFVHTIKSRATTGRYFLELDKSVINKKHMDTVHFVNITFNTTFFLRLRQDGVKLNINLWWQKCVCFVFSVTRLKCCFFATGHSKRAWKNYRVHLCRWLTCRLI